MSKKSHKLPKRVAGYKLPKLIRRHGKPLMKLASHPEVQALLGSAIAAGAAVLFENQNAIPGKWTARKLKRRLGFLTAEGKDHATELAEAVGRAVANAIGAHLPARSAPEPPAGLTH